MRVFALFLLLLLLSTGTFAQDEQLAIVYFSQRFDGDVRQGLYLLNEADSGLYVVQPDGSGERQLISSEILRTRLQLHPDDTIASMMLAPDGARLAVVVMQWHLLGSGEALIRVQGSIDAESVPTALYWLDRTTLTPLGRVDGRYMTALAWSPDSSTLAYADVNVKHDDDHIIMRNLNTGDQRVVRFDTLDWRRLDHTRLANANATLGRVRTLNIAWSPDGTQLAVSISIWWSGQPEHFTVLLLDLNTDEVTLLPNQADHPLTSAAWGTDPDTLIVGCLLAGDHLCQYNVLTNSAAVFLSLDAIDMQHDWIQDSAVASDGRVVVSLGLSGLRLWLYDPQTDYTAPLSSAATILRWDYNPTWITSSLLASG